MKITLSSYFENLLKSDTTLLACVNKAFNDFGPWIESSGMPFFPGFTDHSPRHINDVLDTASSLTSDSARLLLSAEDACVIALAILLHDCGMHLTQDGFRSLILDDSQPACPFFDKHSWQTLWQEFLAEASRFNHHKLEAIFGDARPIDISKFDSTNLNERDLLLAGEFVRRHHARLAHEIALKGVPPFANGGLSLDGVDDEIRDIAGLVARSHNMPIRGAFAYLEERYAIPEYRKIKIPFLMGLLRIADYIQVQSERANANLLKVKELRSSLSIKEWKAHFAVRDVSTRTQDPEAIFVTVEPKDAKTFLKLSALFKDIQRELDETWATFGEVYGRFEPLNKLGLTIRRIRSTLDDIDKFAKRAEFLPLKAAFTSSDAELLDLLIGPLYGYDPSVGVRELIQNSVDSCRELADLNVDIHKNEQKIQRMDVEVKLSEIDGRKLFSISDRGTGMTPEIILNYFLVAGASFRNSDAWKALHTDEKGQSRVIRGGRFGVGGLAAFLIGKKIQVETRHYSAQADAGIRFECSVGDEIIELRKATLPIGTTISIEMTTTAWTKLAPKSYDIEEIEREPYDKSSTWTAVSWFGLENPSVSVEYAGPRYDHAGKKINTDLVQKPVRLDGFRIFSEYQVWKELPDPGVYERVVWSPKARNIARVSRQSNADTKQVKRAPELTVNGIRVGDSDSTQSNRFLKLTQTIESGLALAYHRPSLSIFDQSGVCPLNLQRDQVNFEDLGIDDALAHELTEDFIKDVEPIVRANKSAYEYLKLIKIIEEDSYLSFVEHFYSSSYLSPSNVVPFVLTSSGLHLLEHELLVLSGIDSLFIVEDHRITSSNPFPLEHLRKNEGLIVTKFNDSMAGTLAWFRSIASDLFYYKPQALLKFGTVGLIGAVSVITQNQITQPGRVRRDILESITWTHSQGSDFCVFFPSSHIDTSAHAARESRILSFMKENNYYNNIGLWAIDIASKHEQSSPLGKRWIEKFIK
jgi:hypothetical protein